MYDWFLRARKQHRQSREAREKGTTSRRSSYLYPPILIAPLVLEAMAEKTLREFSVPSTDNVATGPNNNVGDVNFELKSSLISMVQASPLCGKPNEDVNAHLQDFLELCDTIVWGVAVDVIKLHLFPFSLLGKAI